MASNDPATLIAAALEGDRRALARLISLVERDAAPGRDALRALFSRTGQAYIVGLTGAPGAGKSTLTDRLIQHARAAESTVAVLAVDPSSPYTGGAILGDRIRMQDHTSDPGVYIRSMASRGYLGGLSEAAPRALAVLDAVGFPLIIVETVGVGQAEVAIAERADTTIVVVNPGWGDTIQAAKAGLMEVGDLFVVNKADRDGVDATVRDLSQMLDLGGHRPWRPPVVTTTATTAGGIGELWDEICRHREFLQSDGEIDRVRRERLGAEFRSALITSLERRALATMQGERFAALTRAVAERRVDPWSAAEELIAGTS